MAPPSFLSPHRRSLVGTVLLVGFGITLLVWQYSLRKDAERLHSGFLSRAQTQATVAAQRLHNYEEMIYSLRDSFIGQNTVTREEFARVAQSLRERHTGVQALEWVKIVPHSERAALEEEYTRELGRPFSVLQRRPDRTTGPAPLAKEYFVISYVEPLAGNEQALGYDVNSPRIAPWTTLARQDRRMKVSPATRLLQSQDNKEALGIIFCLPYSRFFTADSPIEGFIQGVFHVHSILAESHQLNTSEALDTYYLDLQVAPGASPLLYVNLGGREPPRSGPAIAPPPLDDPADFHETLTVGDRQWLMVIRPNAAWLHRYSSLQPHGALAAGLTITILLAFMLNSLLQRTARIEREVAERTRELRATEIRLQDIVDHSPAIIFLKDSTGRYLMCNQRFVELSGRKREDLVGHRDHDFCPADAADQYTANDAKVMAAGKPMEFEEIGLRPDGTRAVHLSHKFPLFDEQGRIYALCGIATDITDRKASEEQKLLFERRLLESQKLESLGVLAGGIAHDFNNILTAILGNANLASLELPDNHPIRPQLRQIEIASRRASDLCAQMLAYAGKAAFITSPVNLSTLVRDTAALLEATVGRRARLELDTADKLPAVLGDATQLRQIVMNLVINAADAIGDRTDGTVEVRTFARELTPEFFATAVQSPERRAGHYVGLEVIDNGSGMKPEILKRIFEPFFTTKFSGRGLGLAAVLGIVQSHQGALFVESAPGRGTTFRLFFPASQTEAQDPASASGQGKRPAALTGTVLVVDDEAAVRLVALKALRAVGLQVIEASDGQAALLTYAKRAADINLVLLDLTMPGLGGEETLRQLRALAPNLPVIVMSGYSEGETMGRCASLGVSGYLAKPFEVSDLVTRLRPYLDKLDHRSA